MDYLPIDSMVYRTVLESLVRTARAPSLLEAAVEIGLTERETRGAFERLAAAHVLVLEEGEMSRIEMAPPFSALPTAHRVSDGDSEWFASCAWEALGLLPLLERDGSIRSTCPDCNDRIDLEVSAGETMGEAIFHISVPARHWWADIRFT